MQKDYLVMACIRSLFHLLIKYVHVRTWHGNQEAAHMGEQNHAAKTPLKESVDVNCCKQALASYYSLKSKVPLHYKPR